MCNNDPGFNAIVIRTAEQILPYCVIRTEHSGGTKHFRKSKKTSRHAGHPHRAPSQPQSRPPSTAVLRRISKKEGYVLAAFFYIFAYFLFAAPMALFYIGAAAAPASLLMHTTFL